MTFEIYHQVGHRDVWNITSIEEDNAGDGMILSPKHAQSDKILKMNKDIKNRCIFDPQILNPSEINDKMATYDFYPKAIMGDDFQTSRHSQCSEISAEKCIDFQIINQFRYLVIPTRYYDGSKRVDEYINYQNRNFINPFLTYINEKNIDAELIVQLALSAEVIKNEDYTNTILTWITSFSEISGVYLITDFSSWQKQINDPEFLLSLLKFIDVLSENDLKVIAGYLNTESVLLSLADPAIMTIGGYENTRKFNHTNFENMGVKSNRRGPRAKVFIPRLLDWIDYPYVQLILKRFPKYHEYINPNKYSSKMMSQGYNPAPNTKEQYMHYFIESSNQLREISKFKGKDRYDNVCHLINTAIQEYTTLENSGIEFVENNPKNYLSAWLTAANLFASEKGWR